ncbi:hypothetical protein SLE2022_272770 [Rubroshorea leprosula]
MELKFNIDAIVSLKHSQVVVVVVCRERNGVLISGRSFKQAVDSILMAEALALQATIGMALSLGVRMAILSLIIESSNSNSKERNGSAMSNKTADSIYVATFL